MSGRDLRVDPKAGDVRAKGRDIRLVLWADRFEVLYAGTKPIGTFWRTIAEWREWAASAEVLHVSD